MEADIEDNEISKEKQHFMLVKDYKRALNYLSKEDTKKEGKGGL